MMAAAFAAHRRQHSRDPVGAQDADVVRQMHAALSPERTLVSLRHLLQPDSVAVIGTSRRCGSPGKEILHNIVTGGFAGRSTR